MMKHPSPPLPLPLQGGGATVHHLFRGTHSSLLGGWAMEALGVAPAHAPQLVGKHHDHVAAE